MCEAEIDTFSSLWVYLQNVTTWKKISLMLSQKVLYLLQ